MARGMWELTLEGTVQKLSNATRISEVIFYFIFPEASLE
jgi:hypothetical protein